MEFDTLQVFLEGSLELTSLCSSNGGCSVSDGTIQANLPVPEQSGFNPL